MRAAAAANDDQIRDGSPIVTTAAKTPARAKISAAGSSWGTWLKAASTAQVTARAAFDVMTQGAPVHHPDDPAPLKPAPLAGQPVGPAAQKLITMSARAVVLPTSLERVSCISA